MNSAVACRSGSSSDLGHERTVNEDRILIDDATGVFLVVDGMGGHAAGDLAAETARSIIAEKLKHPFADAESAIRNAITAANNRIYEIGQSQPDCQGMACVLTLAVAHNDHFTVGHVGDSRLYLIWNGNLRKITSDHSFVGEKEDRGELNEIEAMSHPRRHEVLRDVGSSPRQPDDAQFIEIKDFVFRPDAAVLLCTDGLSDVLTAAQMRGIIERYDGDPAETARLLTKTANDLGGQDNISAVFVAGPEFTGSQSGLLTDNHARHSVTRVRGLSTSTRSDAVRPFLWLIMGMVLGALIWFAGERLLPLSSATKDSNLKRPAQAAIDPADPLSLSKALVSARAGDTIFVPAGQFVGPLHLKDHVAVIATDAGQAVIVGNPSSEADPGIALVARGIAGARVAGLKILGNEEHPLRIGALIQNSSIELDDVEVSGAIEAGVRLDGSSKGVLLANFVHGNLGPGLVIADNSAPRLVGNWVTGNGKLPGAPRAGMELLTGARPNLENNSIFENGVPGIVGLPPDIELEVRGRNFMDPPLRGFTPKSAKPSGLDN